MLSVSAHLMWQSARIKKHEDLQIFKMWLFIVRLLSRVIPKVTILFHGVEKEQQ